MSQILRQLPNLFLAILILSFYGVSNAFTISEYKQQLNKPDSKPLMELYIAGVGQGIFWSSVYNQVSGKPGLFCPPDKLPFSNEMVLSILNKAISDNRYKTSDNVQFILVLELTRVFPCE